MINIEIRGSTVELLIGEVSEGEIDDFFFADKTEEEFAEENGELDDVCSEYGIAFDERTKIFITDSNENVLLDSQITKVKGLFFVDELEKKDGGNYYFVTRREESKGSLTCVLDIDEFDPEGLTFDMFKYKEDTFITGIEYDCKLIDFDIGGEGSFEEEYKMIKGAFD